MWIIALILVLAVVFLLTKKKQPLSSKEDQCSSTPPDQLDLKNAYQQKWMFSYNEKEAYWKLKKIAEAHNYILFAKVRLLDLLEPTKGNPKYKTFFYKAQAKHVDFVLCDQKLVARIIVELDDNSHDQPNRKVRDAFVDEILTSTGYKIIHTRAIEETILD